MPKKMPMKKHMMPDGSMMQGKAMPKPKAKAKARKGYIGPGRRSEKGDT